MGAWEQLREEVVGTVWPRPGGRDGVLPPLLLILTLVTGLVDATSYLKLGHVFVANMTGNVVFVGFALAGAHGLSVGASLLAVAMFIAGSVLGGRLATRPGRERGHLLRDATAIQFALIVIAAVVAVVGLGGAGTYVLVLLLAPAMGLQNACARKLAVADLTTTVLTLTLTGIASDARILGGPGSRIGRRLLAVAAMLVGALIGGLLALHVATAAPLVLAALLVGVTSVAAHLSLRHPAASSPAHG
ncbi:MAG TPA: YoaK family protein [Candidatus Dormibacteraeota bacterium]|jgi:uncharacterized membrane protein YoaK (UPF0700 family)|nr:YoaK family protein [Candidatus Dormibacteraeota bacterium]